MFTPATTLTQWAWVDSNYQPHAYQAARMAPTGAGGRQMALTDQVLALPGAPWRSLALPGASWRQEALAGLLPLLPWWALVHGCGPIAPTGSAP